MEDIDQFITQLKIKHFSVRTIEDYALILIRLHRYHKPIGKELYQLHRNDIREYIIEITKTNNTISTNHHIVVIRHFFNWMVEMRNLPVNPCIALEFMEEDEMLPVFLVKHELHYLYKLVDEDNSISTQDVTMLDVMVGTGMRTTEMCNLKTSDYFEDGGTGFFRLRVTKGGKQREVAMPDYTRDSVIQFMAAIKLRSYTDDWIFPNSHGKILTRQAAYNRISKMLVKVKSQKKGGHTLRHTFATLAIMRDVPLSAIQMQLGHEDPNTTAGYTHLNIDKMIEVHRKAHPKG
jgi:site-specific recombinase XerD